FGYGYLTHRSQLEPPVWLVYWAFRLMVGIGSFLMLYLVVALWLQRRDKLATMRWMLWLGVAAVPMVYVAGQAGWVVAEVGRQPWAIYELLPVQAAVSQLPVANIMVTFFLFLLVFTLLLAAEVGIMCKAISRHTAA
ncbi:MAG: cytochrome ubiquinol oxidase subunit I, partial [Alloprevotella sp.]